MIGLEGGRRMPVGSMASSAEQMRAWSGPALLTYGFRPFFLGAAVWAALAMALWLPMLAGGLTLPTAFEPVAWHAHELLFGYLAAVAAGFLLTAVPNWTGRLPIVGWPLAALACLWIIGRLAVFTSAFWPAALVATADLAFLLVLAAAIAREIVAGRNWRNLIVLAMLSALILGNAVFHWEAARGDDAARGVGLRIGLGAAIMMIAVIGGRIVPSFTRNWLVKRGGGRLPAPPMQTFDKIALLVLLTALIVWIAAPEARPTGVALVAAALLHAVRLARWAGERSWPEPLLWVLHVGYALLPLGALALGLATLRPDLISANGAQHVWMAGAIGLMTLAVMTRATLGHTGRPLTADGGTTTLYLLMILATVARLVAGLLPTMALWLWTVSALAWIASFAGFALLYGGLLLRRRPRR
jgi:uncharacterized protein involved in response to NO